MKTTMRAAQISRPKGEFEIVERPIPAATPGTVRIKVTACGICHSDVLVKEGLWPGLTYPRVPGHEITGTIDAVGEGATGWASGDAVGVGWHGGHCGHCASCRRGDFFACTTRQITGISFDGGYAEYVVVPATAVTRFPGTLSPLASAPLMCAGHTTFDALRSSGARAGAVVAVLGLGGLGHLGVQYAAKMGFTVVAIARGSEKEALARQLGATVYIDSRTQDPASELQKLGGADVILSTVTAGAAVGAVQGGLATKGTLMLLGVADEMQVSPAFLILGRRAVKGYYCGAPAESEDTLHFSARFGVQSINEVFPLERVNDAFARMVSGRARYRVVLTMAQEPSGGGA